MIINRKDKRCRKKLMVSIRDKVDPIMSFLGVTSDISKNGICIVSSTKIPLNKKISILIATESNIITVKGNSKWNYTQPDSMTGTGISINSPPVEYIQYINKIINV